MAVDRDTVARVAQLTRIRVPEGEMDRLAGELSKIIGFVEQLNEVDTSGVAPIASVANQKLRWREDKVTDGDCADDVLANAPDARDGYFTVPKVIE
jgi:aspartyl-tRNA(Asn)/glutamyl-tRNA(Gln) amidotransferase subunit C